MAPAGLLPPWPPRALPQQLTEQPPGPGGLEVDFDRPVPWRAFRRVPGLVEARFHTALPARVAATSPRPPLRSGRARSPCSALDTSRRPREGRSIFPTPDPIARHV